MQRYGKMGVGLVALLLSIVGVAPLCGHTIPLHLLGQAQYVKVLESKGMVEVQFPRQTGWKRATVGMNLPLGATISTSIGANALLEFDDSVMTIRSFTRMKIRDLIKRNDSISSDVTLQFGSVGAKVRSTEDLAIDFILRSTITTASVRGTDFDFDGRRLTVREGSVRIIANDTGRARTVWQGGSTYTDTSSLAPLSTLQVAAENAEVSIQTGDSTVTNIVIEDDELSLAKRPLERTLSPGSVRLTSDGVLDFEFSGLNNAGE